jgi:NADPH2:quinone reductase
VKAVRIHETGGPEVLVYEDVPTPSPGAGQVLVRVEAASVNPIDAAVRAGAFPTPKHPPKTIGSDGAGVVAAVGDDVDDVSTGDEVFFQGLGIGSEGSYAEYAVVAAVQCVPKPGKLSFPEAAAMGLVFPTAYYALVRKGKLQPGETVLVQGAAGGVGTASVQLAKALGARVLGTVGSEEEVPQVRDLGADEVIVYKKSDVGAEVARLTDGRGVDLIHELVVSENLPADIAMIARGGRIVCTGQGPRADVAVPIGAAIGKDAALLFMSTNNAGRAGVAEMMREIARLAEEGTIKPVVGKTLRLAEARRAHELLAGPHIGKIVLVP